ncbi:hypothetical protein [Enhygromyxa salina]|uniref:VWFA domain-containing protein n=1 Tax=Enhygromyxa salina TaxID=215803 RepID=A0A2S9YTM9_9BACT|nr:hypothetical protein [Enhygromyxa salina]PRQ08444.1 hypothetical protein ENSA7_17290 [Enhygromyxa salina]
MVHSLLRYAAASALILAPFALSACPGGDPTDQAPTPPLCGDEFRLEIQPQLSHSRNVDILFVIDNTATMAQAQVLLNDAIAELFTRLDAAQANYRIAFTTTDSGNPWCPPGATTPEAGNFVLSSCTTRLDEFSNAALDLDVRDLACSDQCSLLSDDLAISPTTTAVDDTPAPRRWIERVEGVSNLPSTTDPVDAFRCFAPQGINGCGFESPLESMYLALIRAQTPDEPGNYGFMRADAVLAVVVLSDEADCSYNKSFAEIFEQDGNKVFWSDPAAQFPSSAVCWNAGVSCTGDPSGYDGCEPTNKDINGEISSDSQAVLHPLSRYVGLLKGLEQQKQELDAENELILAVIGGVEGAGENWSVNYAEASDAEYQLDYGIGPGCTGADGQAAVPPVRMRALAEAIDPLGLYSICDDDFSATLADLGERITAQFEPICFNRCVADADLSTPQLEPSCVIEQDPPGNDDTERVQACERAADGSYVIDPDTQTYQLPAGVDVCYVSLVDPDGSQTADPNDNLSDECADQHVNLEFVLVRRHGVPTPDGTRISASCELSDCADLDCPLIGS